MSSFAERLAQLPLMSLIHEHDGALAFAKFLSSPAVASTIVAKGMEPYAKVP